MNLMKLKLLKQVKNKTDLLHLNLESKQYLKRHCLQKSVQIFQSYMNCEFANNKYKMI